MSKLIRFALCSDPLSFRPAFDELAMGIAERIGLAMEPLFVSSYAGLAQAIETNACDAAWLPPVVAQSLYATGLGRPIVTAGREGRTSYYSVVLARPGAQAGGVEAFAHGRMGWVSKLSAAGYVVPALYLRSLGFEPDEIFGEQIFLGSHDRVLEALSEGSIDFGATYAQIDRSGRRFVLPNRAAPGTRVVLAAGPIPGDVIFATARLGMRLHNAIRGAFLSLELRDDGPLARMMGVDRFEVPTFDHFARLRRWQDRAFESQPRIVASS